MDVSNLYSFRPFSPENFYVLLLMQHAPTTSFGTGFGQRLLNIHWDTAKIHPLDRWGQQPLYPTNCWISSLNIEDTGLKKSGPEETIEKSRCCGIRFNTHFSKFNCMVEKGCEAPKSGEPIGRAEGK